MYINHAMRSSFKYTAQTYYLNVQNLLYVCICGLLRKGTKVFITCLRLRHSPVCEFYRPCTTPRTIAHDIALMFINTCHSGKILLYSKPI